MQGQAYNIYRQTQVHTAGKEKLFLMLYDGIIRNLEAAEKAVAEKSVQESHKLLLLSQDILEELMVAIDFNSGEIGYNLYALYNFMYRNLVEGNTYKDQEKIKMVREMLTELNGIWSEIETLPKAAQSKY